MATFAKGTIKVSVGIKDCKTQEVHKAILTALRSKVDGDILKAFEMYHGKVP